MVTASADKTARLWDAKSGQEIAVLKEHTDQVLSAAFSPDGRRVVTASNDNTARLWDAESGKRSPSSRAIRVGAERRVQPGWRRVVTASDDNTARLWDAASGSEIAVLKGHTRQVSSAAFSPDGQRVVTASDDKTARLWDAGAARRSPS